MTLDPLKEEDFYRILTETHFNLLDQQIALLATEGVEVAFSDEAKREICRCAVELNLQHENIGARRLFTVIEKLMEHISFGCEEFAGQKVEIDVPNVRTKLSSLLEHRDLSKYIL